jgi:hypothetical protein
MSLIPIPIAAGTAARAAAAGILVVPDIVLARVAGLARDTTSPPCLHATACAIHASAHEGKARSHARARGDAARAASHRPRLLMSAAVLALAVLAVRPRHTQCQAPSKMQDVRCRRGQGASFFFLRCRRRSTSKASRTCTRAPRSSVSRPSVKIAHCGRRLNIATLRCPPLAT